MMQLTAEVVEARSRAEGIEFVLGDTYKSRFLVMPLKELATDALVGQEGDAKAIHQAIWKSSILTVGGAILCQR